MHIKVKSSIVVDTVTKVFTWKIRLLGVFHVALGIFLIALIVMPVLPISPLVVLVPYLASVVLGIIGMRVTRRKKIDL